MSENERRRAVGVMQLGRAACCFGGGAVAEGEFHELLNLAALWKPPVLFLCENKLCAIGDADLTEIERRVEADVEEAVAFAEARPGSRSKTLPGISYTR